MEKIKFLILGAGPSGLGFAKKIEDLGESSFLILEQESSAGGLCRSVIVDGSPFDIGGGHFLDVRRPRVNDFLFRFMPEEEWKLFERDSRIKLGEELIGHPFEAHIWQLPIEKQVEYLESIARAGCNMGAEKPEKFVEWIVWKLGEKIANDYMLPYNRKLFAGDLDCLGTYWLDKLPNVSFRETLLSCLEKKMYGTQPGHARFYYPLKYGYGEVWLRIAETMKEHIYYNCRASSLNLDTREVVCGDGRIIKAEYIITTVPWTCFNELYGLEEDLSDMVKELKSSSIETRYVPEKLDTEAHWVYIPDESIPYHRILVRHNFCPNAKGYWLETRRERTNAYSDNNEFVYVNQYAYPLNTCGKEKIMKRLLAYSKAKGVFGLGRWGEHNHYNSDVAVERALLMAETMI